MNVAEDIFETVVAGLRKEARKRVRLSRIAIDKDLSFAMDDERELGTAYTIAHCLNEADYFSRLDWYYYGDDDRLRPDITVWTPLTQRVLYFELKRLGQGWSYDLMKQDMEKLVNVTKNHPENKNNGLFVVQFTEQKATPQRLKAELNDLKQLHKDYEILGYDLGVWKY